MEDVTRRSVMALGVTAVAAMPLFASTTTALAAVPEYGLSDGVDMGSGRRMVEVGIQESQISAYKSIRIIDVIYPPGTADPPNNPVMKMDMICFILAGEFTIQKTGIPAYTVKTGEIYTCGIGKTDQATNISNVVGVHRIALLMPA